jgi:hypothetical protein
VAPATCRRALSPRAPRLHCRRPLPTHARTHARPPRSCVSEHVATTGDIGRPPAQLAADFPWLADQLAGLPDTWWHTRPGAPNCCAKRQFKSKEPMDALRVRGMHACVPAFLFWCCVLAAAAAV